jgi:tetratricopeptide (TPR) repeat protein
MTGRDRGLQRQPNLRLRDALAEAAWTGQQLATAVNAAGREIGLTLSFDRTAVAHWLAGTRPRSPTPKLIAEVFSRRLGHPVTPADLGLIPATAGAAPVPAGGSGSRLVSTEALTQGLIQPESEEVVAALAALADSHGTTGPRSARQPAYSLAALAVPGWPQRDLLLPRQPAPAQSTAAVTAADVVAAEHLAQLFATCDAAFGAGPVRPAAAFYLAADLSPKLYAPARPARRRRLFAVTAEIAYLCGFECFDDELHGLGQRYYRAALRLAAENEDQATYAITLRGMSVQACSLGHHQEARRLAEAAAGSVRRVEPIRQAFLLGQLAVAGAADGDRAGALASLAAAEHRLDRATSASVLIGAYHLASLAHQQGAVQSFLGDKHGAIAALSVSIRHRPGTERRARAVTLAALAELQQAVGHLDEAVETWHRFLDDYPYLHSRRVTTALHALRRNIRPHTRNPAVRALMQRATAYTTPIRSWTDQTPAGP